MARAAGRPRRTGAQRPRGRSAGRPHAEARRYVGLRGEFLVLAELARQGLDGMPAPAQSRDFDLVLFNRRTRRLFKVQVKTSTRHGRTYSRWPMEERQEAVRDRDLVYCFVLLERGQKPPRFFWVRADDVATFLHWEHRKFRRRGGRPNPMRVFRIPVGTASGRDFPPSWRDRRWEHFEENWRLFSE